MNEHYWSPFGTPFDFHALVLLWVLFAVFGLVAAVQVGRSYWKDRHWIRQQKLDRKNHHRAYLARKNNTERNTA